MNKTTDKQPMKATGDLVLQEVWRAKDTLSASYGHDLDKLFAETRKRVADLQVQTEQPFEYQDRLASLSQRQDQLEEAARNNSQKPGANGYVGRTEHVQDASDEQHWIPDEGEDAERARDQV